MAKIISSCPVCQSKLHIATLACSECGLELKNTFDISPFESLGNDNFEFLMIFLRNRGNLKKVQEDLGISYPTAKRRLDEILMALDIFEEEKALLYYVGTSRARLWLDIITTMDNDAYANVLQVAFKKEGHIKDPQRELAAAINAIPAR